MHNDEFKQLVLYVLVFWLVASTFAFAHINLSAADDALAFKLGLMGGLFGPAFGFYMFQHRGDKKRP
ncbi:MAG: hypothetical protein GC134_03335 [Proteobacteria bacterium]|nr:hypothetical protein [Pseudomonadota bacterium]